MKRAIGYITVVVLALVSFSSCLKDSDVLFTTTVIADVEGTTLVTDNGIRYDITNTEEFDFTDIKRVVAMVYAKKQISDTEYEGTIYAMAPVLVKDYLVKSAINEDEVGNDAVNLDGFWYEGQYISVRYNITSITGSETKHLLNLVYDDVRSGKDTVYFELRHNAYKESYEYTESLDDSASETKQTFEINTGYASFPCGEDFIKDGQVVHVDYEWLTQTADGYYSPLKRKYDYIGTYKKL